MFAGYDIDWGAWVSAFAVLASLVMALISYYSATKAKEASENANKITEKTISLSAELEIIKFREKWLYELRGEMANFSTSLMNSEGASSLSEPVVHHQRIKLLPNPYGKLQ